MSRSTSFETVYVTVQTLNEEVTDSEQFSLPTEFNPSVTEILELLAVLSLREQVFMIANLLTISGFQQKEIAEAMGVPYSTYRNTMLSVRQEFRKRGVNGL